MEIKSKFQTSIQDARSNSDGNKGCRVLFPWRGREMLVANLRQANMNRINLFIEG